MPRSTPGSSGAIDEHDAPWTTPDVVFTRHFAGWGYSLPIVYLIYIFVVLSLYPLCSWFGRLKDRRRDWWLAYR
jgi:hypothetical protein